MNWMLFIVVISVISLIILLVVIVNNYLNLKKMNQQLEKIMKQSGTNELLKTDLSNKELNRFVTNINQLVSKFKKEEQTTIRRNKELRQEITNISHDIRTPLTSIKGFSELLEDPDLTQAERQEYLSIIQKKATILMKTVDTFYEISKLESEDEEFELTTLSFGDLLIETLLPFQKDFENKKLSVTIDDENLYTSVWVDKKATERIILNIIQNALRYSTSFFKLAGNLEEDKLVIQFVNDATYISNQDSQKIFDRSFTIDKSRQSGQTGFGLYIVKQLVEKQNGTVTAKYKEGKFILTVGLPIAK